MKTEPLFAWHQLATDVAHAYGLSDSRAIEMATQLSRAIQTGTVKCWEINGDPIRGAVALENIRNRVPHLTVTEGNAWLEREGYLQKWVPAKDRAAKHGTNKRWTGDEVKRLAEYRESHSAAETAAHFKISESLIRSILAKEKKKTQTTRPKTTHFSGLGKR